MEKYYIYKGFYGFTIFNINHPGKNAKTISYSTINDYGGETPIQNIKL